MSRYNWDLRDNGIILVDGLGTVLDLRSHIRTLIYLSLGKAVLIGLGHRLYGIDLKHVCIRDKFLDILCSYLCISLRKIDNISVYVVLTGL